MAPSVLTPGLTPASAPGATAPVYLMSPPRADWGLRGRANVFAKDAEDADPVAARADWLEVALAVEAAGGVVAVVENPDRPELTGLPYCAEAGVCAEDADGGVFILPRLTPPHRQAEVDVVGPAVSRLGLRPVPLAGTAPFEGQGDVLWLSDDLVVCTWGVGPWARTQKAAATLARGIMAQGRPHGEQVEAIALGFHADPWFHGNTFLGGFVGPKGQKLVLGCREAFLDAGWQKLCTAVAAHGSAVLPLSVDDTLCYPTNALQVGHTVIAPSGVPGFVVDAWRAIDLAVVLLPLPALFRQGGGAAVCLTNHLRGLDPAKIPDDMRLDHWQKTKA